MNKQLNLQFLSRIKSGALIKDGSACGQPHAGFQRIR